MTELSDFISYSEFGEKLGYKSENKEIEEAEAKADADAEADRKR